MPLVDYQITLRVERPDNKRAVDVTVRVAANGTAGLTIPAGGRTKIGDSIERMVGVLDQDRTDL